MIVNLREGLLRVVLETAGCVQGLWSLRRKTDLVRATLSHTGVVFRGSCSSWSLAISQVPAGSVGRCNGQ